MRKPFALLTLFVLPFSGIGISPIDNNKFKEISEFIENERKGYNIPSVVVGITDSDSTVFLQSFGGSSADGLYLIGSNSKSFTALITLLLDQKGLLDIEEPVTTYLPWFKYGSADASIEVTVKDLLQHTSGIPRKSGMQKFKRNTEIISHYTNLLEKVLMKENQIRVFEYSNLNYQILGLIIEKVTSRSYADVLKSEILVPAGMETTFGNLEETTIHGLVPSYQYFLYYPLIRKPIQFNDYEVPSGFISSTAEDMCKYLRLHMNFQDSLSNIVGATILEYLFTPNIDSGSVYGMGWENRNWQEFTRYKHDGLTQSFSCSMLIIPDIKKGLIIMSNINNSPSTIELADGILRILSDKPRAEYAKSRFYIRNSLPFFAAWIFIVLFLRIRQWARLKFSICISRQFLPNFILVLGIAFGLFWIIYFPSAFKTPLQAIIDYEPNSGYSLTILSFGIILNSLIGYTIKAKRKHSGTIN